MAYSPGPGPVGYIFHSTEPRKVLIHPDGGAYNPDNNTDLIITGIAGNPGRLQFRIDPKDGDEWGYIEHISSKKVVYPRDGSTADDTRLVLIDLCCIPESKRSTAYFKFDQKNKEIEHKSGKVLDRSDSFVVLRTRGDSRGAKLFLADRSGAALDKAIR